MKDRGAGTALVTLVLAMHDMPMKPETLTWEEVCAIPWLKNIPAKIETNKHNKIMVPALH